MCQWCRNLQQTETDPTRLRSLSGAWFTEERMKRHHIWSGSALVHATIRHRRTKSRGPLTVYTMLLLQACSASFSYSYRDTPLMLFCGCCYSNRCIPEWAVQWRERKPQTQHHSWCWEKTAPAKRWKREWRVSVGHLSVTEKSSQCVAASHQYLYFVLFSGVTWVWNLPPYPEQKVPEQRSVFTYLLLCLFLKNNHLNRNHHLHLQDLPHRHSSMSSKGTTALLPACVSLMVSQHWF